MKREEIVEYLKLHLASSVKSNEPPHWPVPIPKDIVQDIIDILDHDDEHHHLAAAVLSLGG